MVHVYNLKNSLKFKLLAFWRKYSFYWPKIHLWKGDKKFGQGPPPPSFGQNPKEHLLFFVKPPEITRSRGSQKVVDCPTQLFVPRQIPNNTPQKSAIQIVRRSKLHLPDLNNLNLDWDPLITFIAKALCLWKPSCYIDKALLLWELAFPMNLPRSTASPSAAGSSAPLLGKSGRKKCCNTLTEHRALITCSQAEINCQLLHHSTVPIVRGSFCPSISATDV